MPIRDSETTGVGRYPAIGLQGRVSDVLDKLCEPDPSDADLMRTLELRLSPYAGSDAHSVYGPVARYVMSETAADWVTVGFGPTARHALVIAEQAGVTARVLAPLALTLWLAEQDDVLAGHVQAVRDLASAHRRGAREWLSTHPAPGPVVAVRAVTQTQDEITYADGRTAYRHVEPGELRLSPSNPSRVGWREKIDPGIKVSPRKLPFRAPNQCWRCSVEFDCYGSTELDPDCVCCASGHADPDRPEFRCDRIGCRFPAGPPHQHGDDVTDALMRAFR